MIVADKNFKPIDLDASQIEALLLSKPISDKFYTDSVQNAGISDAHTRIIGNLMTVSKTYLAATEVAPYIISRELGWDLVPPTVLRKVGKRNHSFQAFIPNARSWSGFHAPLDKELQKKINEQRSYLKVFDALIINSDRHGGNSLVDENYRIWAIDNHLTFNRATRFRSNKKPEVLLLQDYKNHLDVGTIRRDIRNLYLRKDEVDKLLVPYLKKPERDNFWGRVEKIANSRKTMKMA